MQPLKILKPDWPQLSGYLGAFTTLRTGGVSLTPYGDGMGGGGLNLGDHVGDQIECVLLNRKLLSRLLPNRPQWLSQVHSTSVLNFNKQQHDLTADACVTSKPKIVCAVLTADCLPVLFCDPEHGVVGAAHAGWRGLLMGVIENTIEAMRKLGSKPESILVWLGPAIGPSKFEVGEEVRSQFIELDSSATSAFMASHSQQNKFNADIYQLARLRLYKVGVHHITGGEFCTYSEAKKFYSYRRDGVTGRMASLIWIK